MSRARYLVSSAHDMLRQRNISCPSCGSDPGSVVHRKYLVTTLRRCPDCRLLYRSPTTARAVAERFYEHDDYSAGFTTDVPSDAEVQALIDRGFGGHQKDYTRYLEVLDALGLGPGARVYDFGCSWGYGSWQLRQHGLDVSSYELSRRRSSYAATKLGVDVVAPAGVADHSIDAFFSSHVLEHLPSVSEAVRLARRMVRPGGVMVSFTPNGSLTYRDRAPDAWASTWGLVHPNHIDEQFVAGLADHALVDSSPFDLDRIRSWVTAPASRFEIVELTGDELVSILRFTEG